jgi:hypothetical protein
MITTETISNNPNLVIVPGLSRSLVEINLVRNIKVDSAGTNITLAAGAINPDRQGLLKIPLSVASY